MKEEVKIEVQTEKTYYVTKGNYTWVFSTIDILNSGYDWPKTEDEMREVLSKMAEREQNRSENHIRW